MPDPDGPEVLLLGAGHTNLLAAPRLRAALPDARITLIDAAAHATYSGMFPGFVAGHYTLDDLRVDLAGFALRHDIQFLQGRIGGLDPVARAVGVTVDGEERRLGFDLAALDIGSHSAMPEIRGFERHGIGIKPLSGFADRLAAADPAAPATVIGGGVAGAEIALAMTRRLSSQVTLIEAGPRVAATLGPRARVRLLRALERANVRALTETRVASVDADAVVLQDGAHIASGLTIGVAGARAYRWLARDLPVDTAGFVRIDPTLQVQGHPTLFAVGDCAAMIHAPRPKAGVFAVRQAPVLAHNLSAAYHGTPLIRYDPQRDYLKIISLGGKIALAEWYGITLHGAWLWRWKDLIDRKFMRVLHRD